MSLLYSNGTELVVRYLSAISVGMLFELITGSFLNHLGMFGSTMLPTLALVSVVAIPIWHLSAKVLGRGVSTSVAEITSAIIVAALSVQPIYFNLYYSNVVLPTVNEYTKTQMLTWYTATTSNITMAILTALIFLLISHVTKRWKAKLS